MKLRASFTIVLIVISQAGLQIKEYGTWSTSSTDPVLIAAAEKKCEDAAAKYVAKHPASPTIDTTKPGLNWSIHAHCIQKT
jgi:hypothetical protein